MSPTSFRQMSAPAAASAYARNDKITAGGQGCQGLFPVGIASFKNLKGYKGNSKRLIFTNYIDPALWNTGHLLLPTGVGAVDPKVNLVVCLLYF